MLAKALIEELFHFQKKSRQSVLPTHSETAMEPQPFCFVLNRA